MSYLIQEERKKVTLATIYEKKEKGEKLARTALYDYPMAVLADEAGIEIINMGDSIATVMLGENSTVKATATFFSAYIVLLLLFSFSVSLDGADIATSFSAALSCLSNIGPGMTTLIGPAGSFAFFSYRTKILLSVAMLMGRLEIYPILFLLSPRTWKR